MIIRLILDTCSLNTIVRSKENYLYLGNKNKYCRSIDELKKRLAPNYNILVSISDICFVEFVNQLLQDRNIISWSDWVIMSKYMNSIIDQYRPIFPTQKEIRIIADITKDTSEEKSDTHYQQMRIMWQHLVASKNYSDLTKKVIFSVLHKSGESRDYSFEINKLLISTFQPDHQNNWVEMLSRFEANNKKYHGKKLNIEDVKSWLTNLYRTNVYDASKVLVTENEFLDFEAANLDLLADYIHKTAFSGYKAHSERNKNDSIDAIYADYSYIASIVITEDKNFIKKIQTAHPDFVNILSLNKLDEINILNIKDFIYKIHRNK